MRVLFVFYRLCAKKDCSYSKDDVQSVGRVYLFLPNLSLQHMATITGHQTFMKLGTSLSVGKPYNNSEDFLAVSAATLSFEGHLVDVEDIPISFNQSGAIYLVNSTKVLQSGTDISLNDLRYTAIFEGDRSYARFGCSLDFTDVNRDGVTDLVFSAPFRTEDITEELKGAEEGQLYVFYGGKSFPSGRATRECQEVEPCPGEKASYVLKSSEERSRLGTTFLSIPKAGSPGSTLVVSSPRSSYKAFHSGSVHVVQHASQMVVV